MKKKVALYMHGGSANHGCEAIVNATCKMLSEKPILVSDNPQEDKQYTLVNLCEIKEEKQITENKVIHVILYIVKKVFRQKDIYIKYMLSAITGKRKCDINMMVGGDNYCYESIIEDLISANKLLSKNGITVLWGCSIEPKLLDRVDIVEDMKRYSLIVARESITYDALLGAGINKNVYLYPDPAFCLEKKDIILPPEIRREAVVGINISPMIIENESKKGIIKENYINLIKFIVTQTPWNVLLIPHVVRQTHDDRIVIKDLYDIFQDTGKVFCIGDLGCDEIKGYISQCRFFVGARTHSTIAAYSSMVPTLVVGYSVKALGIAKDIFGTTSNYVISVQDIESPETLTESFQWLAKNEEQIRKYLKDFMPQYIEKAMRARGLLDNILEGERMNE